MVRHPGGRRAGETSDFFALTHDVTPTVLGALGVEAPQPMQGADLSVLFDGGKPGPREHVTVGYHNNVFARDDRYAMFAKNDGSGPHLFDLSRDPKMNKNIAGSNGDVVKRMWNDYVMRDAGGALPS